MSSTTGIVDNQTPYPLNISVGGVSHGLNPNIEINPLPPGNRGTVFIAMSDGAGVEGNVVAAGPPESKVTFTLFYDNPVVGSNSGNVTSNNKDYTGTCGVGSGDNNTNTYTLKPA
jgi:hypothetical protein